MVTYGLGPPHEGWCQPMCGRIKNSRGVKTLRRKERKHCRRPKEVREGRCMMSLGKVLWPPRHWEQGEARAGFSIWGSESPSLPLWLCSDLTPCVPTNSLNLSSINRY
jgi:hypothetical protein